MVPNELNWINAIAAIPLAIIGFTITIVQIRRAKSAADAAKTAAESAQERFKLLSSATVLPQLVALEVAFENAVQHKSVDLLRHVIHNWVWQAGVCRQYIEGTQDEKAARKTQTNIQKSITSATDMKSRISKLTSSSDWHDETANLRAAIGAVTGELGILSAKTTLSNGEGQ